MINEIISSDSILLCGHECERIKDLPGFQKHYRIPDAGDPNAESFIKNLGADRVSEKTDALIKCLKTAFRYKRKDIQLDGNPGDNRIVTPHFSVYITIGIDDELWAPGYYRLETQVTDIKDLSVLESSSFPEVFDDHLNQIIFPVPNTISIDKIIDKIEDIDDAGSISVEYGNEVNPSYCEIKINGLNCTIQVDVSKFTFVAHKAEPIGELIASSKKCLGQLNAFGLQGLFLRSDILSQ